MSFPVWRRVAVPFFALLMALLFGLAIGPSPSVHASSPVPMAGQVTISQAGARQQALTLSAQATDGSGWHLAATLSVQQSRLRGGATNGATSLAGEFTLTNANAATVTGSASGEIGRSGAGQLRLTSDDGSTTFDSNYNIDSNNGLTLNLNGTLPPLASAATAPDTAAVDHSFWYISCAAGLTAYLLLALSVCLGLLVRTRIMDWLAARWRWFDLHQFTALLALGFVFLHVFSLLGDHYIGFTLSQLLVPFDSPYRALPTAAGVVAFYLVLAVVASFWIRRFIGYRAWRSIHYLTFALFLLALVHGIFAGTDTGQTWTTALYWGSGMLAGALTIWRFTTIGSSSQRPAPSVAPSSPRTTHLEAARR